MAKKVFDYEFIVERQVGDQWEWIAGAEDFSVAVAAFDAACSYRPDDAHKARHGARIIREYPDRWANVDKLE